MNVTKRLILEELKALKEFLFDTGLSNPVWVLLVPLVCGLFASQILWMIYVLWLERPIVVNQRHVEEEEAEIRGDVEVAKMEDVKERGESKEKVESENDGDAKSPFTPARYKAQPPLAVASIFPLSLPNVQLSYLNSSFSEPTERKQDERSRDIMVNADSSRRENRE
ncbi:unnamed protein product [Hydatigera taeniaeformis]|uniref:Transmembrane protein n=1 Tax=Hydatigena taeniaeformis TaxID=6205 RepID=A0A0R3WQ84_HYDTA|nr:unnamed protein product [Hydatigera taeniaeformis]